MMNVTMNAEKNGIEVRFDSKPETDILDALKVNGFRWSRKQKMWYAKQNDSRIALVNSLSDGDIVSITEEVKPNKELFNLWKNTRTDEIENHYANEHLHDTKEIAARIRKHLRARFPMCKWSVRSDINSVDVSLKATPWAKDSEEVQAIAEYACRYTQSFNYDNSDSMTDYFDVNFYGSNTPYSIIDWQFEQKEETVNEHRISELFYQGKAEFEKAEEIRKQKEYEEYCIRREIERKEYEEREKIRNANHVKIEQNVVVEDVEDYFILGLKESGSKSDSVKEYEEDETFTRTDAKVSRNVRMDKETYEMFSHQLMDNWSFLEKMGGSDTYDNRINDMSDFETMDTDERSTVKWFSCNCVAVYCEDELMMVIDPQGFDYARYCFFPDEVTENHAEYEVEQIVSDEEKEINKGYADILTDASTMIIAENNMLDKWDNERFTEYKELMKAYIYENAIPFNVGVVREFEISNLKAAMRRLLTEVDGMQEQFKRADIKSGQKITMIRIADIGGITPQHMTFKYYEDGKYAQYDDAVKIVFRPEKKRKDYYTWLYNDVIIFDGYVDFPETLLWKITGDKYGITKMSKYHMHDHKMYDDILEYFKEQGIKPIVNTYKPEF